MALGRFLFPALMTGFLGFLFAFLFTTPATPAPDVPDAKLPRAMLGDTVVMEMTAFYELEGRRYVWFSTEEERRDELSQGPVPGQFQSQPVSVELGAPSEAQASAIVKALLGKRQGEKVVIGPLPAREYIGDWEAKRSLPREFSTYPYSIRLDGEFELAPGQFFNVTEYMRYWQGQGVELKVGTQWACEGDLWDCSVTRLDPATNVLVYRRLVAENARFPITNLLGGGVLSGDNTWQFTIISKGENFAARLDPPVGTLFTLRTDVRGAYQEGSYRVTALGATTIDVDYSSATPNDPRLIGLPTVFEAKILQIEAAG